MIIFCNVFNEVRLCNIFHANNLLMAWKARTFVHTEVSLKKKREKKKEQKIVSEVTDLYKNIPDSVLFKF